KDYPNAEAISEATFYATQVDLFIPAALEQMVDLEHAEQMNCKVLVEGANAPTTPRAERHLLDKGVEVLPAILCNAGGVTVSYFEWKQNRQSTTWDESVVDEKLRTTCARYGQAPELQHAYRLLRRRHRTHRQRLRNARGVPVGTLVGRTIIGRIISLC
ncbi:MAG: hypothetical protein ACPGES_00680, partial [Coraliomargarita sp.]